MLEELREQRGQKENQVQLVVRLVQVERED
jgi:hypothetical protein